MKTKIVPTNLLTRFHEESFYGREKELLSAAPQLAERLGIKELKLYSFNETTALYKAPNGHLLRAGYGLDREKGCVTFEDFADVIVDDISLLKENRKDLSGLVASLLDGDEDSANQAFDRYLNRKVSIKEATEEALLPEPEPEPTVNEEEIKRSDIRKVVQEALGAAALFDIETVVNGIAKKLQLENSMVGVEVGDAEAPGLGKVSQITIQTVDTKKLTQLVYDKGEKLVESIVKTRRDLGGLGSNEKFKEAVLKVKSLNATGGLEEIGGAMSEIVTSEANLLYMSIEELADQIRNIFESEETPNWDEELCLDIAEGAQKLAVNVYQKTAAKIKEATQFFLEEEVQAENEWEAYKEATKKMFANIREGEEKLRVSVEDLSSLIERVSPILKDEGYRRGEAEVGTVGRTLERYKEELASADLDKLEEVVNFVQDYILREALQLGDDGSTPPEAHPATKGNSDKDPNNLPYRVHKVGNLGPYGEKSKLLEESVEALVEEFGLDFDKVVDWLSEFKEENEEATFEQAVNALKEAWQLGDDGDLPKEAQPKKKGDSEKDANDIPYRAHEKKGIGYKKDADSKEVDELNPDGFEEVGDMSDLVVPAKGKTADPEIAEAWQLGEDGKTPEEVHPKKKGDSEKDANGLPYRVHDKNMKLGPYGEKPELMDDEDSIVDPKEPKISVNGI